jgi:hypothetical protein
MAFAIVANGQTFQRRATMKGGGNPDSGQCTVEVVVDGAAQVEIRGDNAVLRNLAGQPPQWRRFECTSVLPPNPRDFRFEGVDGRGRQQLTADPRNGGVATVRIDDPDNGSEGYTFRILWSNGLGPQTSRQPAPVGPPPGRVDPEAFHIDRDQWFRRSDWRATIFQRIHEDLDHVTADSSYFTGDRSRLQRTDAELDELQSKLSRGFYDAQELDDVIGAMQAVMQANRLDDRDRAILGDDLSRMRDFRAQHDQYGARNPYSDNDYHHDRDQQFNGDSWRKVLFQRVREDLDHVTSDAAPFGGDRARLARTQFELDELQQKLARGNYDERELDDVLGALDVVLRSNRLRPDDRQVLSDDMAHMRDFRARHEQYGAR